MQGPEGHDASEATAGAEAAFASYIARIQDGDGVDFDAFCAERPALADSLRMLHDAWRTSVRKNVAASREPSIRAFLSKDAGRGNVDLDDEAPRDEPDSGVQGRLEQIASRTGRYQLREEVARGGMGVILKVWDKDLRRTLAMKATFGNAKELSGSNVPTEAKESLARFLDEAQITSQLDHPGIVPVHELGFDEEGRMYFTMRLVKGRTLDEIIRLARKDEEGWSRPGAVGVLLKVCEAMAFAHSKGVIHRDLKPANIMVGKFGEVYVMDWGLAKVMGRTDHARPSFDASLLHTQVHTDRLDDVSRDADSPLLTLEGTILGTPAYMPPEQAEGRIDELDPRSDVYSVGALLYTLLTGRMPYVDPDNPIPLGRLLLNLIEGPPQRVAEIDSSVPPELVAICDKAMARKPGDRYATMVEMATDLRAFVENRVVSAYQTGAFAEFKKWVGRNRAMAASLAAFLLVAIGGSLFVAWQQSENVASLSAANRKTEAARKEAIASAAEAHDNAETASINAMRAERQSYLASLAAAHASLRMRDTAEAKRLLAGCPKRYRGWEWRYLDRATDTSLATFRGHTERVTVVDLSPDGKTALSGSDDKTVRLWDVASGATKLEFPLPAAVTAVAFSPDGSLVAAASKDRFVRVWDIDTNEQVAAAKQKSLVNGMVFLGVERIATATDEGAFVWEVDADRRKTVALEHEDVVYAIAALSDGSVVVTADELGLHVWNPKTGEKTAEIELEEGATTVALAGDLLAAGCPDEIIRVFTMGDDEPTHELSGHADPVMALRFAAGGKQLVSASLDKTVRVWDAENGVVLDLLQGHDEPILAVACAGNRIVSGSADRTLRLWSLTGGGSVLTLRGDEDPLAGAAFDPTGRLLAAASNGHGEIRVFDTRTGAESFYIAETGGALSSVVFSPDGKSIVAGGEGDGVGRIHDAKSGKLLHKLEGHQLSIRDVAVNADSTRVATASDDNTVRIWDLATGKQLELMEGHIDKIVSVAFGPGELLVCGAVGGTLIIRDGMKEPLIVRYPDEGVLAVAVRPDGKWVAAAGTDNTIRFWEVATGKAGPVLRGHGNAVLDLAFSPDGTRLASASKDKTVRIWDAETGESLLRLHAHDLWVESVAFSPDGTSLATASADATAKIWRTE